MYATKDENETGVNEKVGFISPSNCLSTSLILLKLEQVN